MRIMDLTQGSHDWRIWRAKGIGGSDAPVILGESPYATREQLLLEKTGQAVREQNFAMRRGNRLEPLALGIYLLRENAEGKPTCIVHDDCDWLRASLDCLCRSVFEYKPDWIVEIKAPKWQDHDLALAGIVPLHYRAQVQHNLLVSGLDRCDYVSYTQHSRFPTDHQLAVVPVPVDAEYQGRLLEEEERFWAEVESYRAGRMAVAS